MTEARAAARRPTICLNMIVKNEAPVIRRCLDSVASLIDAWVIVDTGSTDGTQEIIRQHLAGIPGELHERPWVDFAHNRTEALDLARGRADYLLFIDADETLERADDFVVPPLTADSYNVEVFYGGCTYWRKQLVKASLLWCYKGVLHEYVHCDGAGPDAVLPGLRTVPRHDGARARDPQTYRRDALLLERALLDEPGNTRTVFYLAQSYRDAGEHELAVRQYRRRVEMGGWPEEVWFSLYQIAVLRERLGHPWPEVEADYLAAFQSRPDRAGPLYRMGMHYQARREYHVSHLFLSRAIRIAAPQGNRLFVERPIYDYLLPVEYAVASFYTGDHEAAIETANAVLRSGKLPPQAVAQVLRNRRFSVDILQGRLRQAGEAPSVVIVAEAGHGAELSACRAALRAQSGEFRAVLVVDAADEAGDDPRFTVVPHAPSLGWDAQVAQIAASLAPRDVVVALPRPLKLADASAVATIRRSFEDARCALLYGQHRREDGRDGDAEPASGPVAFEARGVALAGSSPLIVRASLLQQAGAGTAPLPGRLWSAAGWVGTRFADEILTTAGAASEETGGVATAAATATAVVGMAAGPAAAEAVPRAASETVPMISCLMVTKDRLALAKRAVRSFADQTWPNRELVVVTDGTPEYRQALEECAHVLGIAHFRIVTAPDGTPLGKLRNMSLEAAAGGLVCQWDDDDVSHPQRLEVQAEALRHDGARACCVTDHLQYLEEQQTLLWIDWTMGGRITDQRRFFPGSLLMVNDPRFRYPEQGPYARRGEDSVLLDQLCRNGRVAALSGMGHLYLYHYHGANTFDRAHHHRVSTCALPAAFIRSKEETIREAAAYYSLPTPLTVRGVDGQAFVIEGRTPKGRAVAAPAVAQTLAAALAADEAFRPFAPLDVRVVKEVRRHATRLQFVEVAFDGRSERYWVKTHVVRPGDAKAEWSFLQTRAPFGGFDLVEPVAYLPALQSIVTRHVNGEPFAERLERQQWEAAAHDAHAVGAWLGFFHGTGGGDDSAHPIGALLDDLARRLVAVARMFALPETAVRSTLTAVARRAQAIPPADLRRVRTHGDFGSFNVLLDTGGGTIIDPSFEESVARLGNYCCRHEDCARFLTSVSAAPGLAPDGLRRIAARLRAGYAQSAGVDPFASPAYGLLRAKYGLQALIDRWTPQVDEARRRGVPALMAEWLESREPV